MKRKLLLVLACILILTFSVSCDAELRNTIFGFMDKAGENVLAPEVTGNVDAVKDIVSGIVSEENENTITTITGADGNDIAILGILEKDDMADLVDAITKAGATEAQKKALQEELAKPVSDDQKEAVQNTVGLAKDEIGKGLTGIGIEMDDLLKLDEEELQETVNAQIGAALGDLGEEVAGQVAGLITGIVDSINYMSDTSAEVTQADLISAQMTMTVVQDVMETLSAITNPEPDAPPFNPADPESLATILELADNLEALSNVGNSTGANFNPFGNLNVGSLIGGLLSGIQ